jgi:hypothetical protein
MGHIHTTKNFAFKKRCAFELPHLEHKFQVSQNTGLIVKIFNVLSPVTKNPLNDYIEREIKYFYTGELFDIQNALNGKVPTRVEQHYLCQELTFEAVSFLEPLCLKEPLPKGFKPSTVRIRKLTKNNYTTFFLELKGTLHKKRTLPTTLVDPDPEQPKVRIELSVPINEISFSNLQNNFIVGTIIKNRYELPIKSLGLVAEVDQLLIAGSIEQIRNKTLGIYTADIEFQSRKQHDILLSKENCALPSGFVPITIFKKVKKSLKNIVISTKGTGNYTNIFKEFNITYWETFL